MSTGEISEGRSGVIEPGMLDRVSPDLLYLLDNCKWVAGALHEASQFLSLRERELAATQTYRSRGCFSNELVSESPEKREKYRKAENRYRSISRGTYSPLVDATFEQILQEELPDIQRAALSLSFISRGEGLDILGEAARVYEELQLMEQSFSPSSKFILSGEAHPGSKCQWRCIEVQDGKLVFDINRGESGHGLAVGISVKGASEYAVVRTGWDTTIKITSSPLQANVPVFHASTRQGNPSKTVKSNILPVENATDFIQGRSRTEHFAAYILTADASGEAIVPDPLTEEERQGVAEVFMDTLFKRVTKQQLGEQLQESMILKQEHDSSITVDLREAGMSTLNMIARYLGLSPEEIAAAITQRLAELEEIIVQDEAHTAEDFTKVLLGQRRLPHIIAQLFPVTTREAVSGS